MIDRATLAAIHVAKKDRGLDEDAYRDMMERVAGVRSARELDANGARLVLLEFERLGFTGTNNRKGTAGDRRPIVQKARALWISLYQLDEVADRRDSALDAFTRRTVKKETLRFCTNGEAGQVVEALKSWLQRVGVSGRGRVHDVIFLQEQRIADQLAGVATPVRRPVHELTTEEAHSYADVLGVEMRRLQLGRRHDKPSDNEGKTDA